MSDLFDRLAAAKPDVIGQTVYTPFRAPSQEPFHPVPQHTFFDNLRGIFRYSTVYANEGLHYDALSTYDYSGCWDTLLMAIVTCSNQLLHHPEDNS